MKATADSAGDWRAEGAASGGEEQRKLGRFEEMRRWKRNGKEETRGQRRCHAGPSGTHPTGWRGTGEAPTPVAPSCTSQ